MSEASFQTLDELAAGFSRLKRAGKLHPLAQERLATLLQDIWPDGYPKLEPGEMPGGRSDLAFSYPDGRYAVFEIFATVSQVAQDLRHLEQSAAGARIAILTDRVLDDGRVYSKYYGMKARRPFPVLNLSEILVVEHETVTKEKLKEYIEREFALTKEVSESTRHVDSRLAELSLHDASREDFGENKLTAGVARLDSRCVIIVAIPLDSVSCSPTEILVAARRMLDPVNWYDTSGDDCPPRYWPAYIFAPPGPRRSAEHAFFWQDKAHPNQSARSRLAITDRAEVIFVSSSGAGFVTSLEDGTGVFMLGRIVAECWKLSGLVAQLYQDIGHSGRTRLCVAMVGTNGTHLGGFAREYDEPYEPRYWFHMVSAEHPWTCQAPNLKFCETVDLLRMEPKKQPQFVTDFAQAISLAYNHDSPRCFDRETGLIPDRYLTWS